MNITKYNSNIYNIHTVMSSFSDTDKIIHFLVKHFHTNRMIKRQSKLSDTSKHFIHNIIHQMELAENAWKFCTSYSEYILPENTLPKGKNYDFITEDIKTYLSTSNKIGKQYIFTIGSRNFTIYLTQPYHTKTIHHKNTYHQLDTLLQNIYICLFTLCYYADKNGCSPNLTFYIYLSDKKKKLPKEKGEPIDKIHANSAFTYSCLADTSVSNEIYIFRKEEILKVLIHECFHSMGLDFSNKDQGAVDTRLAHTFQNIFHTTCIDCNNIRFYETYCEMWAEVINILFVCVKKYKKHTVSGVMSIMDMKKISRQVEAYLQLETLFSLFQCAKILHHYQIRYRELFSTSITDHKIKYTEKTNVFSYYFLHLCTFKTPN